MSAAISYLNDENKSQPKYYPIWRLSVALGVILLITFFPYLFGGKTFLPSDMIDTMTLPLKAEYGPPQAQNHYPVDGLTQTYTYKVQTQEALTQGTLAYWNPHILGGYPQYAESLANNFDVFNVLLFFTSPLNVIHIETILQLLIAGIGMLLLLRFLGLSPLVNLLFSAAYMLNSLFIASAAHRCTIAAFCWLPFVILMILRYFYLNHKGNLIYASLFMALAFFGGNFQTSFFFAFVVSIVILLYPPENPQKGFANRIQILAFIGIASFALSAMMWLPTMELLFHTIFRGGSLNSTSVYGSYTVAQRLLSLPLLFYFFLPTLAGSPEIFSIKNIAGVDMINFNGALGFLPALFAFTGCFVLWKDKTIRPFIVISVLGLLLPILTPLYSILYHRFFIVASFSLCIVGGMTFQAFVDDERVRNSFRKIVQWTKILFVALLAVLGAVSLYIAFNYQSLVSRFTGYISPKIKDSAFGAGNESWMLWRAKMTIEYYAFPSLALWLPIISAVVIILTLSYYQKGKLSQKNFLGIVLCASVLQLVLFARMWFPTIDTQQFPIYPTNPINSYLQADSSGARYFAWRDPLRDPYILPANSSSVYGINDLNGYESCTNRSMSVFYKRHIHPDSLDLRLLGLSNVKYIVTGKRAVPSSTTRFLFSSDSLMISENLLCKSRAYFAYNTRIVESDSMAAIELLRPNFDGHEALYIEGDAPNETIASSEAANTIRFDRSENEEINIHALTSSRGVLILTDTYYPGWKCYINGIEKPIYRVNNCMRSVIVDAGESTIIFRFEPSVFTYGKWISISSLLMVITFLVRQKKNRTIT